MQLYEEWIQEWMELAGNYPFVRVGGQGGSCADRWDSTDNQLILRQDAAAELGGGSCPALSVILYTEEQFHEGELWVSDIAEDMPDILRRENISDVSRQEDPSAIFLCGPDIGELSGDVPFARVILVGVKHEFLAEEFKRYQLFRSIEYIRYRVNPCGYMPRISTARNREQVRVAAEAVRRGIDFQKVGNIYQEVYCAHPAVEWVKQYFITSKDFDYKNLQRIADGAESVTMSLDHPLNNLQMDCNSCNLKAVCDEVEQLCGKET